MPGNLRRKSGGKGSGRTEKDYERARRQIIRESQICFCGEAIDLTLKPICRYVDTSTATVGTVLPRYCSGDEPCGHPRKAHPFSASADHIVPIADLPPGSPLLTSVKNLRSCHVACNRLRGAGNGEVQNYRTSKNHYE